MSSVFLRVEVQPGASIEAVSRDTHRIAVALGIEVEVTFQDVLLIAHPAGSSDRLVDEYRKQAKP